MAVTNIPLTMTFLFAEISPLFIEMNMQNLNLALKVNYILVHLLCQHNILFRVLRMHGSNQYAPLLHISASSHFVMGYFSLVEIFFPAKLQAPTNAAET